MFSGRELIPGSELYNSYYKAHPELEILDNLFRDEPGLLSEDSAYYNKEAFEKGLIAPVFSGMQP